MICIIVFSSFIKLKQIYLCCAVLCILKGHICKESKAYGNKYDKYKSR